MVEIMKYQNEANAKMDAVAAIEKEKAEKAIMMDLWGWMETNTETYTDAFNAIEDYNRALRKVRNCLIQKQHHILVKLTKSLAAQLILDAELYEKLQVAVEELRETKPKE